MSDFTLLGDISFRATDWNWPYNGVTSSLMLQLSFQSLVGVDDMLNDTRKRSWQSIVKSATLSEHYGSLTIYFGTLGI
jgi:hypothetical protein